MELGLDNMNCPLCSANARQIGITNDIASINCTVCGEYLIARSVLAKEQLQTLDQEERRGGPGYGETFSAAGRSTDGHNLLARFGRSVTRGSEEMAMELKEIIAVILIPLVYSVMYRIMRSNTILGRWMQSEAERKRRAHYGMLSGQKTDRTCND
jgi:predicted RNA-binding Zn-ribbon protein involved in translation (DUF1610 family)